MADLKQFARQSVWGKNDCFDFAVAFVSDITGESWKWERPEWLANTENERDAAQRAIAERGHSTIAAGIANVLGLCDGSRFFRVETHEPPKPGDIAVVLQDDNGATVIAVRDRDHMWKQRTSFGVGRAVGKVISHYRRCANAG